MAQPQYFDALNQSDKNSDQQFYSNVEERTVQYVITPDKSQVQFQPQQIVVTSGEQLMVVDGQPQQIVELPSGVAYQGQQIQQSQIQTGQVAQQQIIQQQVVSQVVQELPGQQYAVVQESSLNNGTRQIYFVGSNNTNERSVENSQNQQQPIVLNHQIGQTTIKIKSSGQQVPLRAALSGTAGLARQVAQRPQPRPPIRANMNQQSPIPRPSTPNQQIRMQSPNPNQAQLRPTTSIQNQIRTSGTPTNSNQLRLTVPNQQTPVRQLNLSQAQLRNLSPAFASTRQQQPTIRAASPAQQPRPPGARTPNQQFRTQNPNSLQARQPGLQARASPRASPPIGQPRVLGHQPSRQIKLTTLNQLQQIQQKMSSNQGIEPNDYEIKPGDEEEVISLADGQIVSLAAYKNMLADKRVTLQKSNSPHPNANDSNNVGTPTGQQTAPKKRNPTPRARGSPKTTGSPRNTPKNRPVSQLQSQDEIQQQQTPNDPSRYAMVTQAQTPHQSPMNKTPQYVNQQAILLQQQQQHQQQQQRIMMHQNQNKPSQANYVIQPPKLNTRPQQQRPLPPYIPSSQIQKIIESTPISEEFSDSIRMLVLLENGEQRLITFTLPKEACTIQEILEQVNVPFQNNTNIQVTEANSNGINYIVTVGNVPPLGYDEDDGSSQEEPGPLQPPPTPPNLPPSPPSLLMISQHQTPQSPMQQSPMQQSQMQQPHIQQTQLQQPQVQPPPLQQLQNQHHNQLQNQQNSQALTESPPSEPQKDQPKLVPGQLALCGACGYLSEDFNKCMRCNRILPENVKSITATVRSANGPKREMILSQQRAQQAQQAQQSSPQTQQSTGQQSASKVPTNSAAKPSTPTKKRSTKSKSVEAESVHVISSDEENDEKPSKVTSNILTKLGSSVTISPISKEPSPIEIQKLVAANKIKAVIEDDSCVNTTLICRTVRIGSYRCIPAEKKVLIDSKYIMMRVPHPSQDKQLKTIKLETNGIVKVLASFNPALPVFFFYLNPAHAEVVREILGMTADGDYYFDPLSTEEDSHRRITLLPDDLAEDDRDIFQIIYGGPPSIMEELNVKEANDILIKTCPKDISKATLAGAFTEIKQLLTYPPEGRGRISINTEDYVCLASDQFLNDVIIDFYLKYLAENLPQERKSKVHIFSTFFYKRLTTKPVKASRKSQPAELDPTLSAAQKRHARVKTWTKNVNLFEKDFVIVPINENAHWFLAIICFPGMSGSQTWDGKPYVEEPKPKPKKKAKVGTIGNVSVTAVKQERTEKAIVCEDPELSDKDEAEGEDSEMESDDSEDTTPPSLNTPTSSPMSLPSSTPPSQTPTSSTPPTPRTKREPRPPIKQPCILIFDSLAGASRSRVVATLRDYLTCEHKAKLGVDKTYDRDSIKGACPKVPQQSNFTDCGLYVLQYVEQFFNDPIKDYHIPIKEIKDWFEEIVVTRKREEIANLIKSLMKEHGKDVRLLPDVAFPTLNGKIFKRDFEDDEMEEEEEEEMDSFNSKEDENEETEEEYDHISSSGCKTESEDLVHFSKDIKAEETCSPLKPSSVSEPSDFETQTVVNPKPDLREFPRQTNKDTLSILKAKRIIRHKNVEGPEIKKLKSDL